MTRGSWVAATALCLVVVTGATGPVPREASAGILAISGASARASRRGPGPAPWRVRVEGSTFLHDAVAARVPTWVIVLVVVLLLLLLVIYLAWTGWKPLISGR